MAAPTSLAIGIALVLTTALVAGSQRVVPVRAGNAPAAQLLPGAVKALAPGKMLVASRELPDPNFAKTVVLIVEHDDRETMGLIINRQSEVALASVFKRVKPGAGPAPTFFLGGPVQTDGVVALLRAAEGSSSDTRHVFGEVYLVSEREPLEHQIAAGADPQRCRVYLGYSGWASGQLEQETIQGAWYVLPGTADLIFDAHPESLWDRLIARTEGLSAGILSEAGSRQRAARSAL